MYITGYNSLYLCIMKNIWEELFY